MIATFDDCPASAVTREQVDRLRTPVYSRRETEQAAVILHHVEVHWHELDADIRTRLRDLFVTDYDQWIKSYRPSISQIVQGFVSIWRGDNFRYAVTISQIMLSVRKHVEEDFAWSKRIASQMNTDPDIAIQVKRSQEEFDSGKFTTLSSKQIKERTW